VRMPDTLDRRYRVEPAAFATALANALRLGGVPTAPERAVWFVDAVRLVPPTSRVELYWSARAVFVTDRQQIASFDRVFAAVFDGDADWADFRGDAPSQDLDAARRRTPADQSGPRPPAGEGSDRPAVPRPAGPGGHDAQEPADDEALMMAASRQERVHDTAFSELTDEELAEIRALVLELAVRPPQRPARRNRVSPSGRRIDLRRTIRIARRSGGDAIRPVRTTPARRSRRIVLLADVSASMEPYTRVFLSLMQGLVAAHRAEAFVFATGLTRLTRQLAGGDADRALAAAAAESAEWSSGTRIAGGIRTFIDEHGRRGLARGAVVVVLSDGWSQDEPADIAAQMARLSRLAHRIVWVNPRKAAEGFRPLAGGMAAALPYADAFVSGHSYSALQDLVRALGDDHRTSGRSKGDDSWN